MKSIRLGLVLAMGLTLSLGFAQGNSKMAAGQTKGSTQAKVARHHGKMTTKSTGKTQAAIAKHHGKMAAKHHVWKKHSGKAIIKKDHKVMVKTTKAMGKEDHGKKGNDIGHGKTKNGH